MVMPHESRNPRESGFSLVEVLIASTILLVSLVTTGFTILSGVQSQDESEVSTTALRAVRDLCAEIQAEANLENDLLAMVGMSGIYENYDNTTRAIPELPNGTITIRCFAHEGLVPAELGGPQDLNFDGDVGDDHTIASGTDLRLAPIQLTVTYTDDRGTVTRDYHRSFSQTTD